MPVDRKQQHRLDPRTPLVLDTRELGRRPGSMRPARFPAPAPEGLGLELIRVAPGTVIELDLRLESVMDGVLVSGTATAPLTGECGRCLDPVGELLTVPVQELYLYDEPEGGGEDAEELARMEGDLLDLEPVLRDAVVLALPMTPLCRADCAGLCVGCGGRLDDLPAGHTHDDADPRWSALQDFRTTDNQE